MHTKIQKVIAGIILKDDKILIAQRGKQDALYGKWEFPGGKMEAGETDSETLERELFEEFGIKAQIGDYLCSSYFKFKDNLMEMRAYFVPAFTGEIKITEHLQVKWVERKELTSYDMPDPDKPIVEKLLTD